MSKQSDLEFLKILQDAINNLNKLDELIDSNGERQSRIDSELSDLLHLIENRELNDRQLVKVARRIKELRCVRRSLRNEYEIIRRYTELKQRISQKENRDILFVEIQRRIKSLNQEYVNRILTQEDIDNLLKEDKVISSKRKKLKNVPEEEIIRLLEMGYSQTKIAKELGITQPTVSLKIKKIKKGIK